VSESEKYDYTTPAVVEKILQPDQVLDITEEQAHEAIKALAAALKTSRERHAALESKHYLTMSDMEIKLAQARGRGKPKLQDGVRYAPPSPTPQLGPDGFPQRGII
jgi:hypothetical protein